MAISFLNNATDFIDLRFTHTNPSRGRVTKSVRLSLCTAIALCVAGASVAQVSAPTAAIDPDGTLHVQGFVAPFSSFASAEARQQFIRTHQPGRTSAAMAGVDHGDINQLRKLIDAAAGPKIEHAKALYPVKIESWTVGDVYTDIVTPADGAPKKNKDRVLINLHGGGFAFGARTSGLMESIPIASVARMKIVTIDYRQGPENHFPAASEDVATVYREVLKQYKPENIGIYGCSAGGMLTGESLVWFQTHQLPRPGAAGMFGSGAGSSMDGDSLYFAAALNGQKPPAPPAPDAAPTNYMAYFERADLKDPLVAPFNSPSMMAKFPPTLIVTSTRDIAMSPAISTHQRLVRLGVDTELHVWDGLQHCFFDEIDLPESKEYFNVVAKFFDKHLGKMGR